MKKVVVLILAVLIIVGVVTACSGGTITGTWVHYDTVLGVVTEEKFVFNEDGTGSMTTILGIETDMTYTAEDGKLIVTVSALGIETEHEYTYEFSKGNLLITANNETREFEKQK